MQGRSVTSELERAGREKAALEVENTRLQVLYTHRL